MKYPKTRLSLLMFVQFFIWGATGPIISLYLRDCLGFSGAQAGLILGLAAVSHLVSPALMTFIADRYVSSERLLCLLNAAAGVFMLAFSAQTRFYPALAAYILHNAVMNPTVPLINAITFHHAPSRREKFGNIRVWGTVGWIAVAWVFSFWILRGGAPETANPNSHLPILLKVSAITSFIMAAYSLTIPRKKIIGPDIGNQSESSINGKKTFFPAAAFRVVTQPRALTLALITASITFVDKFYTVGTAPFLKQAGFSERGIMPAMSLGQAPEIVAMGILGYLLTRWGPKKVLIAGMALEIFRFAACAFGAGKPILYASLSVHGLAYTFTMITAVICLDAFCGERERTGAHQMFAVLTSGIGGFLGSYAAGLALDFFTGTAGAVNYRAYWAVPLFISIIILVTILLARTSNNKVNS